MLKRIAVAVSLMVPLAVYVRTLSPTVNFGDTGELITAAATLGIPHPPGSPIWVSLAHLFTYIPLNSVAWRVNLSSAVFSSLAVLVLLYLAIEILKRFVENEMLLVLTAMTSVLLFAFTREFWSQAVISEVYALHVLLGAVATLTFVRYVGSKTPRYLYATAFVFGLSLTNHYLALLLIPPIGLWVLLYDRSLLKNSKLLIRALLFFILGLSVFLYLPIRSAANPPIDWGNPETLSNFVSVVTREQFSRAESDVGGIALPIAGVEASPFATFTRLWKSLIVVTNSLVTTFTWPLVLVGVAGIYPFFMKARRTFWLIFLLYLSTGLGFAVITGDFPRPNRHYIPYIPSFLFFTVFIAAGLSMLIFQLQESLPKFSRFLPLVVIPVPIMFLFLNYSQNDFSSNTVALAHAQNMQGTMEKDSLLFAEENEWLFPLLYLHVVEGERPDITVYDRNGNLFDDIYREAKKDYRTEQYYEEKRRALELNLVSTTGKPAYYAVDKVFENYQYEDITVEGILYRQGQGSQVDFGEKYSNILSLEPQTFGDFGQTVYIVAYYHMQYAEQLQRLGRSDAAAEEYKKAYEWGQKDTRILNNLAVIYLNMDDYEKAKPILQESIDLKPDQHVAHNNLGTLLMDQGDLDAAAQEFAKSLEAKSTYIPAVINLASIFESKSEFQQALNGYEYALRLNPANRELEDHVNLLKNKISGDGTESIFQEALDSAKEGDCNKAIEMFGQILEKFPTHSQALNNTGVCYARMGDFEKAREFWEKALAIDPENRSARENLERMNAE